MDQGVRDQGADKMAVIFTSVQWRRETMTHTDIRGHITTTLNNNVLLSQHNVHNLHQNVHNAHHNVHNYSQNNELNSQHNVFYPYHNLLNSI